MSADRSLSVGDLRFGVECEFTDPETATPRRDHLGHYRVAARARCGDGRRPWIHRGPLDVGSAASGVRTRLFPHLDQNVIEIVTEPLSLADVRERRALLQATVWDACHDVGLAPGTSEINRWSMHINVSWPALAAGRDGDLLLRYVADFNDHPELAMGGCGGDIRNAPPLAILGPRPRDALRALVAGFPSGGMGAIEVATRLRQQVFRERFVYGSRIHNDFYHAINVCHVRRRPVRKRRYRTPSLVRVEIRASYMAPSAAHMISAIEIVAARLTHLSRSTTPPSYGGPIIPEPAGGRRFQTRGVQDGVTPDAVAACWLRYVTGAGLDAAAHVPYLVNPDVRNAALRLLNDSLVPPDDPDPTRSVRANQDNAP